MQAKEQVFCWFGVDSKGQTKQGEISAINLKFAKLALAKQGINIKKIKLKPQFKLFQSNKITSKDITYFTRQLTTMLKAGLPILQALTIISTSNNKPSFKQLINSLQQAINNGHSLMEALQQHPKQFDVLYINLINAGEQSGALDIILENLAINREKNQLLKAKINKALYYPITVILVAIIVTIIMLLYVIPQFQQIFASFNASLPLFTLLIIRLSHWLQANWLFGLVTIASMIIGFFVLHKKNATFRIKVDSCKLKLPIVGSLLKKTVLTRFCRNLAITFNAGVPILNALELITNGCGSLNYAKKILQIKQSISQGQNLHQAMQNSTIFPEIVLQMVMIGEESGTLDQMLHKIADNFEQEVDNTVDGLSSLIEPVLIVVLGVIIGGLVLAMYLPIFNLGSIF